ncbi:snake venom 5'-nucleotidase-like [Amphiura filiformis]|uniref:snake venom 5'-nucleotidase-like n=1 Tax=Amphiura filiformis TaxID=82378 RepID=UPI003B21FEEA
MNKVGYDAMTIGNSEIAISPDDLAPFLQMANFPVVSANLDASQEPSIDGLFSKSAVKTYLAKDGSELKVGIVGYGMERINEIANVRNAEFTNVIEAVQAEVNALTEAGIEHIILLSHLWGPGDISLDLEVARTVKGVDIIVGGGVNYFHFDGCPPDIEEACDSYPIIVTPDHDPEGKVLVVHSPIWGKYIGRLNVMFNKNGSVSEWYGNPVLLDSSIEEDPECLADIRELIEGAPAEEANEVVGRTHVLLEGYPRYSCRMEECNMGNLITDAMVWKWATLYDGEEELEGWTKVATAVFNSGGIRDSIEQGNITYHDLVNVLPFGNTLDIVDLEGRYIREMLEHSAAGYYTSGQFLQMAGMRVTYDVSKDPYDDRVVEVMISCAKCEYPQFEPLDDDETYTIALPSFLADGYDGYDVIAENAVNRQTGEGDVECLIDYIDKYTPIYTPLERRITIISPIVAPVDSCLAPTETNITTTAPPATTSSDLTMMLMSTAADAATSTAAATSMPATSSMAATTISTTTTRRSGGGGRPDKPRKN